MTIALIVPSYGGYDPVVPLTEQNVEVDWIVVTDGKSAPAPAPWREIIEPRPHLHPRLAAKVPKCRPDLYSDAEILITLDASGRFHNANSVSTLIAHLGDHYLAQFTHPERMEIYPEAEVSLHFGKYAGQEMKAQVEHYRAEGLPPMFGLWATGCIVRRQTPAMREFGDRWLFEQCRWSWQDQLSEPYVLWKLGLIPAYVPGKLWANDCVGFDYISRRAEIP